MFYFTLFHENRVKKMYWYVKLIKSPNLEVELDLES
jgi:hypothetical protein